MHGGTKIRHVGVLFAALAGIGTALGVLYWVALTMGLGSALAAPEDVQAGLFLAAGGVGAGVFFGLLAIMAEVTKLGRSLSVKEPPNQRSCPFCHETIPRAASVCGHCGRESAPWVSRGGQLFTKNAEGKDIVWDAKAKRWTEASPSSD